MGLPRLQPLPGILLAVTMLAELGAVGLSWGLEPAWDTLLWALSALLTVGTGALILSRHPRHAVGWLLCVLGLVNALTGDLPQGRGLRAAAEGWAGGLPAEWLAQSSWPLTTPLLVAILLLFPTGHLPNRRWSTVLWLGAAGAAILATGYALDPDTGQVFVGGRNPYAAPRLPTYTLFAVGLTLSAVALVAALVAAVNRLRRSSGVERQQMKWFALSSGFAVVALPLSAALWAVTPLVHPLPAIALTLWPIAIGVAILRYRLFDIDLLITRTVVYGLLTALFTAVYLVIVVGVGTLIGSRGNQNLFLPIVATAVIAVAFQPARERSRRLANRLVYGERASPYEVLSEFSRGMAGASTDDSLLQMARLVVEATGAEQVTVWLRLGDLLQPQARWPPTGQPPDAIALDAHSLEALVEIQPGSQSFPVAHEQELLGALTVTISPREPLTPASEKLIADLAAQTGLGLRFQRMKERALFARALASFLPPEVAELVEASPSALSLREEVEATILFSDIRGFSSLAERLPPREVVDVVERHLEAMVEVVTSNGGVLDKFAGDAVMAVFGAPRPTADHARRALLCAAAMQRRQMTLNEEAVQEGLPAFQIGIGVNTGMVIAGTLGGPGRLDYTVLGDAVNIAQRLQATALGGEILATVVTVRQSGTDQAEPVGLKQLKGHQELVDTYRIRWAQSSAQRSGGITHGE